MYHAMYFTTTFYRVVLFLNTVTKIIFVLLKM